MSLKDKVTEDMKTAMRARDADRLLTLRGLLAAIKQREIDERIELDDMAVVAVVDRLIKQRKDSISQFGAAGRSDLVAKETAELGVLEGYLPQRLNAAEIATEVAAVAAGLVSELGRALLPSDMGKLMGAAKAQLGGKADMGLVSTAVKKSLGQ